MVGAQVLPLLASEDSCTQFDLLLETDQAEPDVLEGMLYMVWSSQELCRAFFDRPDVSARMLPMLGVLRAAPQVKGYEPQADLSSQAVRGG